MVARLFLVERYLPDVKRDALQASIDRLSATAEELTAAGEPIRYLGSTFVPGEESCFCRLEAASARVVDRACRQAQFRYARILEAEAVTND